MKSEKEKEKENDNANVNVNDNDKEKEKEKEENARKLGLVKLSRAINDRAWAFFVPIFLGSHSNAGTQSWRMTAIVYCTCTFFGMLLIPSFSKFWDSRRALLFIVAENMSVVLTGLCLELWRSTTNNGAWLLLAAGLIMSVETSVSSVLTDVIEKDLQYRFSDQSDNAGVAKSNARMAQIDLIIAATTPILASYFTIWQLVFFQVANAAFSFKMFNSIIAHSAKEPHSSRSNNGGENGKVAQPTLIMLSFTFLFFSVITPNGMMLSWVSQSMDSRVVAFWNGFCQLAGFLGASFAPRLISFFGLSNGAKVLITVQATVVSLAALLVWFEMSQAMPLLLGLIAVSRVSLWGYDMLSRQILQELSSDASRLFVFSKLASWTKVASLALYLLAASGIRFQVLACLSALATAAAALALFSFSKF
eukprot:g788.t1